MKRCCKLDSVYTLKSSLKYPQNKLSDLTYDLKNYFVLLKNIGLFVILSVHNLFQPGRNENLFLGGPKKELLCTFFFFLPSPSII